MTDSNMLLIVPSDWVELDAVFILGQGTDPLAVASWLSEPRFDEFAGLLENIGIPLPVGQMITEGKIFDDGSGYRIWIKLANEM